MNDYIIRQKFSQLFILQRPPLFRWHHNLESRFNETTSQDTNGRASPYRPYFKILNHSVTGYVPQTQGSQHYLHRDHRYNPYIDDDINHSQEAYVNMDYDYGNQNSDAGTPI